MAKQHKYRNPKQRCSYRTKAETLRKNKHKAKGE